MNANFVILNTNFSKEHQAVITRLIYGLADLYLKDKTRFFPYPETMIDESQTSPAPDILLYDHANEKTVVIIEVTHPTGFKKDLKKVRELMEDYDIAEGFVYDYKKHVWVGFEKSGEKAGIPSFSHFLQTDLNDFLKR